MPIIPIRLVVITIASSLAAGFLAGCSKTQHLNPQPKDAPSQQDSTRANRNAEAASQTDPPLDPAEKSRSDYTNPFGMMFMKIGPGTFQMGAPDNEVGRSKWEGPVHTVTINYSFLMGKFEVTQGEYEKVMGTNPSATNDCDECEVAPYNPVENVSWNDAQAFIAKLNRTDRAYRYRLPSEAEWEFACRAGTSTVFAFGDQLGSDQANFDGRTPYGSAAAGPYLKKSVPVGSYRPNAWGIYDMHGNVSEWVEDYFHDDYSSTPVNGDAIKTKGTLGGRVIRGGHYLTGGRNLRCSSRNGGAADFSPVSGGFRIVAVPK